MSGLRRVAVVRHDRLGDFVLALPAIDALRRTYPEASLALIVSPANRALAEMVDGVHEVVETDSRAGGVRRYLRGSQTDLVVCISRGAPFALAAARAGVPHRVGAGLRVYSPLFTRRVDERRRAGRRHELEYSLSFAHRAGAPPGPARFPLRVPASADGDVRKWLEERELRRFVMLHPGSGGSCPRWPLRHFVALARRLVADGLGVVVSRGPADSDVERAWNRADPAIRRIPLFDRGLPHLVGLIARAAVVVSHSTGPIHLAAALKTPTVALHAPWPSCGPQRWGPYDSSGWTLVADDPGALGWSRRERRDHGERLMAGIPPEVVLRGVRDLLRGDQPGGRSA